KVRNAVQLPAGADHRAIGERSVRMDVALQSGTAGEGAHGLSGADGKAQVAQVLNDAVLVHDIVHHTDMHVPRRDGEGGYDRHRQTTGKTARGVEDLCLCAHRSEAEYAHQGCLAETFHPTEFLGY